MADKDVVVRVNNVSKTFKIPTEASNGVKQKIINTIKGVKGYREFTPLDGIDLVVEKGDFFGIVGRNGSGKSTLLKTIAGIYTPTKGGVKINGTLVPFIELGVGFNPELTGRENVFLNGALLGFSHEEVEGMYNDIVEFAEISDFMEEKLKNYSSGMQVRLAFSIAIKAQGDILILDEVLAVGDEAFQRKCSQFFQQIKKDKSKTVILVTHSMTDVTKYCNKAILLRDGKVFLKGSPETVADEYSLENLITSNKSTRQSNASLNQAEICVELRSKGVLNNTESLDLRITYTNSNKSTVYPKIIINYNSVPVMAANAKVHYGIETDDTSEHIIDYKLPLRDFNKGEFSVAAVLVDSDKEVNVAEYGYDNSLSFIIKNPETKELVGGAMVNKGTMEMQK